MRKFNLFILGLFVPFFCEAQNITTSNISDWSKLQYPGFYESQATNTANLPTQDGGWYWGVNAAHSINQVSKSYFGGQMVFQISQPSAIPNVYVRSTNTAGNGTWAKLLHNQGLQSIEGNLNVNGNIKTKDITAVNGNFTNDLTVGVVDNNAHASVKILGPNSPILEAGQRDISFEFIAAGKSIIRAFRSEAWGNYMQFLTTSTTSTPQVRLHIHHDGRIGIGTVNPGYQLDVNGTIRAKEVKIETGWADFVFKEDYELPTLLEVENHIHQFGHLPDIPSEAEVQENGIGVSEITTKLLQKIEELTLYTLQQEKRLEKQEKLIDSLLQHLDRK